jgi:hypothetical protein
MKHQLFNTTIELGSIDYCSMGGDHHKLVAEARWDRIKKEKNVDESAVVCARCIRAISLKI